MTTDATSTPDRPRRRDAEANRTRILQAAHTLLITEPNASMDGLAQAAGVVRRTLYAHFPTRDALITGLGDKAAADILDALSHTGREALEPAVALADFSLTIWTAGDQYRLLISLAESEYGTDRLRDLLAPIRAQGFDLLARARDTGRFATHLPLPVLSNALQSLTLSLLRSVNDDLWTDSGDSAARAILIAAGLPGADATAAIEQAKLIRT
ncbi:TetR/AcrR family transcriptional regulator [Actinoplanes sp. NPDC023936]|uniref:TetR/AcrR family transcriptional regulator n=1 Tax=Actinoplanes sp. NPDC023936 TaxID=3154910 RepID=UPI0033C05FC5